MFNNEIKVSTNVFENGMIESDVIDLTKNITRTIINTQEKQIRDALISLGWTPPTIIKENDMEYFDHIENTEKKSYRSKIYNQYKTCPNCDVDMKMEIIDNRFMKFKCELCENSRRIEL